MSLETTRSLRARKTLHPTFAGLLLAVLSGAVAQAQDDLVELARQAKGSVVALKIVDRFGGELGEGTGFYVSDDGWIATNHHVVDEGTRILAQHSDGTTREIAGILALDEANDLAVLQAAPADGPMPAALKLGDSDSVETGLRVVVLGNPQGFSGTLSEGLVSAIRDGSSELFEEHGELLQISAAISLGSSGSPVMTYEGEVVGVVVSTYVGGQNLNFAVPSARLAELMRGIEPGTMVRPLKGGAPALGGGAELSNWAYARNVGVSILFFVVLYFAYRRLK